MASLSKKKSDVSKKIADSSSKSAKNKKKSEKKSSPVPPGTPDSQETAQKEKEIEDNLQKIVYDSTDEQEEPEQNGTSETEVDETGDAKSKSGDAKSKESSAVKPRCKLCFHVFDSDKALIQHEKNSPYHKRMLLREEVKTKGLLGYTKVKTQTLSSKRAELKDWYEVIDEPLIGLEHIVEVQRKDPGDVTYYFCKICAMSQMPVVEHIISRSHKVECLLEMYEEHEAALMSELDLSDEEKNYLKLFFIDKMYPPHPTTLKLSESHQLINRCVAFIIKQTGPKEISVFSENRASGLTPSSQPPLTKQIKGHKDDDYPDNLKKKLEGQGNFSKAAGKSQPKPKSAQPKPKSAQGKKKNAMGGYHQGGASRSLLGNPSYQTYPGRGYQQPGGYVDQFNNVGGYDAAGYDYGASMDGFNYGGKCMSMLEWLHGTAQKLDHSAICVAEECQLAREVIGYLRNGITMYNNNEGYDEIATYPAYIDSRNVSLVEWLRMTVRFFNAGWLCSPREVTMAHVVISQLSAEVEKFQQRSGLNAHHVGVGRGRGGQFCYGQNDQGNMVGAGYTGGYGQQSQQYDPYSQFDDVTSSFASMSLGRGRGVEVPDYLGERVFNPKTGKMYFRRPGKSHYTIETKK